MEKNIILVDFENLQYINSSDIKEDTRLVVFVGYNQNKLSLKFAMDNLDNVSSIELIKVKRDINVKQKNALDFFITYYLGVFIERYGLLNLNYIIYSNDLGFDPLIKHLKGNNISIKREDKNIPSNEENVKSEKQISKQNEPKKVKQDKDIVEKIYDKLVENMKKTEEKQRPKTQKGLEGRIKTLMPKKNTNQDTIDQIIKMAVEKEIIFIDDKSKIKYKV